MIVVAIGVLGTPPLVVIGGALAMSSTAIVFRQLADQADLNLTHSRLAVGILLFRISRLYRKSGASNPLRSIWTRAACARPAKPVIRWWMAMARTRKF